MPEQDAHRQHANSEAGCRRSRNQLRFYGAFFGKPSQRARGFGNAVKYWEIIADNLSKAGWSLGWVSALDLEGRTMWIVDAHGYGKRFIVRADEMLTAFVELQREIHEFAVSLIS